MPFPSPIPVAAFGPRSFHLPTRPLLAQHQGSTPILADDVERTLADVDPDHGDFAAQFLGHSLFSVPPRQLGVLGGLEHGRPFSAVLASPPARRLLEMERNLSRLRRAPVSSGRKYLSPRANGSLIGTAG